MDEQHEGDKILHQDSVEDVVREVLSDSGANGVVHIAVPIAFDDAGLTRKDDVFNLSIAGATGGTYTLVIDGIETDPLAYDLGAGGMGGLAEVVAAINPAVTLVDGVGSGLFVLSAPEAFTCVAGDDSLVDAVLDVTHSSVFDVGGGIEVYTPTVNDVLTEAWFEITVPWDGTTPKADVGTFENNTAGLWYFTSGPQELDTTADDESAGDGMRVNPSSAALSLLAFVASNSGARAVPCKFTATHPLKVLVSDDGMSDGNDPGATQGAAILHLLVIPAA